MPKHTDSCIIEHHEDGSRTVTTVETMYPVSKKQQAAALAGLTVIGLAPLLPIAYLAAAEKIATKRAARKERKLETVN